jgi:hypothetical protein
MEQVLEDKKPAGNSSRNPFPLDAATIAIRERFLAVAGHMDLHHLWTDECGAFFRVNWWCLFLKGAIETGRISRSAFVRVFHDGEKLQVEDRTNVAESGTCGTPRGARDATLPKTGPTSGPSPGL